MNIILNGPGRSGTTLLSKLISYQKDLSWISGWVNRYPNQLGLSRFNFLYRKELFGLDFSHMDKMPKPAEAYNFWHNYLKGFNNNYKPTDDEIKRLKNTIRKLKDYQNKNHFITKITGDLRANIFDDIFPDYKIIWIERDPRVVVSSYIKQRWFYKDKVGEFNSLSMEEKITFYSKYYMKNYLDSKKTDKKVVFYEDLCQDPIRFFDELLSYLDLDFTDWHKSKIRQHEIKKVDWSSYQNKYSLDEANLLDKLLMEPLQDYKYV